MAKYPIIIDAHNLGKYRLLIDWSSGEQSIIDITPWMNRGSGALYKSEERFKDFTVEPCIIYWGDRDFVMMQDDLYEESFPYSAIVTSSGIQTFLSMSQIKNMTPFPMKNAPVIRAYTHADEIGKHKAPHVHIIIGNNDTSLLFDGSPAPNITPPDPPFNGKMMKRIRKWLLENRAKVIEMWNKENPQYQVTI